MKKLALGRGLDALMPDIDVSGGQVVDVAITDIDVNPNQPRRTFDKDALEQLAQSIKEVGILQPVLVKRVKARYVIVAGERRFRAAKLAGLRQMPCIVRDFTHQEQMEAALIENLQREDLNPIEEAVAVRSLMDNCHYTQEKAAERLGKSRPAIANLLRLLTLPDDIRGLIQAGQLSEGHGRVLASVEPMAKKRALAARAVEQGLSVRQLEKLANEVKAEKRKPQAPVLLPEMKEFEEKLLRAFGCKAVMKGSMDKGEITLKYRNRTELESMYDAVMRLTDEA